MGIIAGIKLFTSVISYKYPALTIFIRCLQGTPLIPRKFSSCCIVFRAVSLSCCFYCPYAISPDMPYVQQKVVIGRL
ncbi:hypothetical protein DST21_24390 [Salmonella enterica subsp. enterica serovar Alachua]|nr:hypothetical protein [Salmonella enterica subsp. enterica]EAW2174846.1 hypothetical protein [Salmonella enterica subsp. enterica]EBX6493341.1 hypothetical protein [Salmonella enterica subsp. enterica serovar Alachua]EDA1704143.1 hypothetical protein [Salmonella enterica subsp. enterica serovar Alachua]